MLTVKLFIAICLMVGGYSAFAQSDDQQKGESLKDYFSREFESRPSTENRVHSKAKLQWRKNAKARKYKTRLLEAWRSASEPNFAGHYFAVNDIGCGTGCTVIFVIDWNTGLVSTPPRDDAFEIRKNSRLMILKPYDSCTAYGSPEFYEFRENHFYKIQIKTICDETAPAKS